MAIGKNKRISKGKKGGKKKIGDPFLKKEWYDLRAPNMFQVLNFGKTVANKSQGTKLAVDSLKGRVFEVNLADLQGNDEDQGFRKIKLSCEDVQGRDCLTDFAGMDITRNHLCSIIKKWHTLIEAFCEAKTLDGFILRLFCIATTATRPNQLKATCYANMAQIRSIRKKMVTIMQQETQKSNLADLVKKFIPESIGKQIQQQTRSIFPLQNVYVRKVKVIKKPKFDAARLLSLHSSTGENVGKRMTEAEGAENTLTAEMKE